MKEMVVDTYSENPALITPQAPATVRFLVPLERAALSPFTFCSHADGIVSMHPHQVSNIEVFVQSRFSMVSRCEPTGNLDVDILNGKSASLWNPVLSLKLEPSIRGM